jgi:hypothetical protein
MTNFTHESATRHGVRVAGLLMAVVLAACGGGGGNPGAVGTGSGSGGTGTGTGTGGTGSGSGGTVTATPSVSVGFTNASGASSTALTGATPLTVTATVLDAAKKPVPNAIVTFATDNTLAVFSPTAGTALTDVNGVATITMRAASLAAGGAGTVTVTSNVAGTTVTGTANYSVGATTLAFGTLTATPASIQAYGSTVLSIDVLSGSTKYTAQQVNVSFSSACVAAGKATLAARTWMFPQGFGTLGFALPAAIGAKIAKPDTAVACVVGDGGFQFTMQEIATAVQYNIGLPVIIFNDSAYSAVKDEQNRERDGRFIAVDLKNPDYVKLAAAYDIPGIRVTSPEILETEIRSAFKRSQPTILDVPIPGWV